MQQAVKRVAVRLIGYPNVLTVLGPSGAENCAQTRKRTQPMILIIPQAKVYSPTCLTLMMMTRTMSPAATRGPMRLEWCPRSPSICRQMILKQKIIGGTKLSQMVKEQTAIYLQLLLKWFRMQSLICTTFPKCKIIRQAVQKEIQPVTMQTQMDMSQPVLRPMWGRTRQVPPIMPLTSPITVMLADMGVLTVWKRSVSNQLLHSPSPTSCFSPSILVIYYYYDQHGTY